MAKGDIVVRVLGDTRDIERKFGNLSKRSGLEKLTSVGRGLTAAVTLPLVAAGAAAVKAFSESASVAAATAQVLKTTGGIANVTAGDMAEYAKTLSQVSQFDDEAIQGGENLLATFTNIRNEAGKGNDIFTQTTRTMLDLSQAFGQDVNTSAIQLGKALQDPIHGALALSRTGALNRDDFEKLKQKWKSGVPILQQQKDLLAAVNVQVAGQARAFANTPAGKYKIAMNEVNNALEGLGAVIAPVITKIASAATQLAQKFQSLSPAAQQLVATIGAVVAAVGPAILIGAKLVKAFGAISEAWDKLSKVLSANPYILVIAATIAVAVLIFKNWSKIKNFLSVVWSAIKSAASTVFNFLKNLFLNFTPYGQIIKHWSQIVGFLGGVWSKLKHGFTNVWNYIVGSFKGALNLIIDAWNRLDFGIHVHVPKGIPIIGGKGFDINDVFPDIPRLAEGGIVSRPTLALIGEAGAEAVVPLNGSRTTRPTVVNNFTINVAEGVHPAEVGAKIIRFIQAAEKRGGTRWRAAS